MNWSDPLSAPDLGFATSGLDRAAERRDDEGWQKQALATAGSRFAAICADTPVLAHDGAAFDAWFDAARAFAMGAVSEALFLGHADGEARFALHVERERLDALKAEADLKLIDMRSIAVQGLLQPGSLNAVGAAKAMFFWHARHRFCGACGSATASASAGWKRVCTGCGAEHFPRTDPVVIMLTVDGDRCLMGRAPRFPETMYSCLAGFMEPGETIEDAVRRETLEEAGITTGRVRYYATQPWPMPGSLMIGCFAEATSTEIRIDTTELADARWFSRDEVAAILDNRHPGGISCPPRMAIANHLMTAFVEGR
ncbi:MAG: NAD(+) diphosphatase [Beijerinckiaceae bacterium]